MIEIAPSVLAAHPLHVGLDVDRMVEAGARILHLDIMDGHFVPNLSFGPDMVAALRQAYPQLTLDVHLMLSQPERFIAPFIQAGADEITIHAEVDADIAGLLGQIKAAGLRCGLSIKPATPANLVKPYVSQLDLILLMSVEPGFGGQQLMVDTLPKLQQLRELGFAGTLSVDGGVNEGNAHQVIQAGATRLVMGTAAFKATHPAELFRSLSQA